MTKRDPWGAACRALETAARSGRFSPGEALPIWAMADEVGFSPTPVREALAYHAGRGLFTRHPGRGYVFPVTSPSETEDLKALERLCVNAAIAELASSPGRLRRLWLDGVDARDMISAIVAAAGGGPLHDAWRRTADRLDSLEAADGGRQTPVDGATIAAAIGAADVDALLAAVGAGMDVMRGARRR